MGDNLQEHVDMDSFEDEVKDEGGDIRIVSELLQRHMEKWMDEGLVSERAEGKVGKLKASAKRINPTIGQPDSPYRQGYRHGKIERISGRRRRELE